MVNLKTLIETRYEKAREMLRWQLNPSRVMTADEVDDHLDRLNPDLTVAAPLPNEASKPAPSVEQDERGVFAEYRRGVKEAFHIANMIHANRQGRTAEETCSSIVRVLAEMVNSGEARAASSSANAAQLDMSLEARLADAEADVKRLHAEKMELWSQVHGYSANVAQGAEAQTLDDLSTLVVRLVRALRKASPDSDLPEKALGYLYRKNLAPAVLRGGAFGEYAAPPAQTALTDEQEARVTDLRHSLEETQSLLAAMLHEQRPREEIEEQMVANRRSLSLFLTAAQSASGDTK